MSNKINIVLFVLFFTLFACKNNNIQNRKIKSIFNEKLVVLPIADDEYDLSYLSIVKEFKGITYLYRKSRYSNDVYVYNWNKKKRIDKLSFKSVGPTAISNFAQAVFCPIDSSKFYIATPNNAYITIQDSVVVHKFLIDSFNKNKKKKNNFDNSEMYFAVSQNIFPPIKIENSIYNVLNSSTGAFGTDNFYRGKLLMKYNLDKNQFSKLNLIYPYFYKNKCWGADGVRYSITNSGNENLLCLFQIKPIIYKFNTTKEKIIDSVKFKSDFVINDIKSVNCKVPFSKKKLYSFATPHFFNIKYDKYRKIYYIFVQLPIDIKTYKSVKNPFTLNPFSIIVLDENFKKIGEQKFKGGIYHTSDFFVTKEGLWLSKNSPHNPNYNENQLRFSLLTLKDEN